MNQYKTTARQVFGFGFINEIQRRLKYDEPGLVGQVAGFQDISAQNHGFVNMCARILFQGRKVYAGCGTGANISGNHRAPGKKHCQKGAAQKQCGFV
jgi:hypothetical protein